MNYSRLIREVARDNYEEGMIVGMIVGMMIALVVYVIIFNHIIGGAL